MSDLLTITPTSPWLAAGYFATGFASGVFGWALAAWSRRNRNRED